MISKGGEVPSNFWITWVWQSFVRSQEKVSIWELSKFERNSEMMWIYLNLRRPQNFGAIETVSQCSQSHPTNFGALLSVITLFDNYSPVIYLSTMEIQKTYRVKNRRRQFEYWKICHLVHRDIDLHRALQYLNPLWTIERTLNNLLSHSICHQKSWSFFVVYRFYRGISEHFPHGSACLKSDSTILTVHP
jgi:hypothetical protein